MTPMVVFDFETGGVESCHPNIQLAAIALGCDWEELGTFQAKIQFDPGACQPEALLINHYDPEVWAREAISPAECNREFAAFLKRHSHMEMISKRSGRSYWVAQIAGYNAAAFDGPRLKAMFANDFLPAHPRVLCVLQRALWLSQEEPLFNPPDFKLSTVATALGIDIAGAHDALADVRLTISVMNAIAAVNVRMIA